MPGGGLPVDPLQKRFPLIQTAFGMGGLPDPSTVSQLRIWCIKLKSAFYAKSGRSHRTLLIVALLLCL
jgi:hypothetical protein